MILIISLLMFSSCVAQQCTNIIINNCQFIFDPQNCGFHSCLIQNTSSDDNLTTIEVYSWADCVFYSCPTQDIASEPQSKNTLMKYCLSTKKQEQMIGVIVGFSVGVPLFILILYCVYCRLLNRCTTIYPHQYQNAYPQQESANKIQTFGEHQTQLNQLQKSTSVLGSRYNSMLLSYQSQIKRDSTICSICLQSCPNAKTLCGHMFHHGCLMEWFAKNKSCPECRATSLATFQLKCSKCLKQKKIVYDFYLRGGFLCKWCRLLS